MPTKSTPFPSSLWILSPRSTPTTLSVMLAFSHSYPLSNIHLRWFWTRKSTLRFLLRQPATAWVREVPSARMELKEAMAKKVLKEPRDVPETKDSEVRQEDRASRVPTALKERKVAKALTAPAAPPVTSVLSALRVVLVRSDLPDLAVRLALSVKMVPLVTLVNKEHKDFLATSVLLVNLESREQWETQASKAVKAQLVSPVPSVK